VLNMNKGSSTMKGGDQGSKLKVEKENDASNETNILANERAMEKCGTAQLEKERNGPEGTTMDGIINDLLPPEIMERIFQMLDNDDLSNVVSVCRRWRDVGECLWNWDNGLDIFERSEIDMLAIKRVQHVKNLLIHDEDDDDKWTGDDVKKLFETMKKNLKKLTEFHTNCSDLTALDSCVFVNTLLAINSVNLNGCEMTEEQLNELFGAIDETTKMKSLYMYGSNMTGVNEDILAAAINQQKRVELSWTLLDTKQVTALLTQAGKQSNLDKLRIDKYFSFRVEEDIVRQAKLNIKDLVWIW